MEQFSFPCLFFHLAFFFLCQKLTHFRRSAENTNLLFCYRNFFSLNIPCPQPCPTTHTHTHTHTTWVSFLHSPMSFKTLILLFGISLPDPLAF